ncbi:diguanylate cyclase domain-containing protein, partial [Streptomyces anulatus]
MNSAMRLPGRIGPHALLITGWAVHAITLYKQIAAKAKDPLTGLLRRDAYTARARRLLARHGDDVTVIMVDADRFYAINQRRGPAAGDTLLAS